MNPIWVVARTKTSRESWAAENVQRQGYTYYFPRILAHRKRGACAEPLFRNYLFVQTLGNWQFLLSTFGISSVVTFANSPATISQTEIDGLRAKEVGGLIQLPTFDMNNPRFKLGTEVRIKGGLFSGYTGIYEGLDAKQREKVLLEFLGRKTSVLMAPEDVEAAA